MLYRISLYRDGQFQTHIGGEEHYLFNAVNQLKALAPTVGAIEHDTYFGYRWSTPGGSLASIFVTDEFGQFVKNTTPWQE